MPNRPQIPPGGVPIITGALPYADKIVIQVGELKMHPAAGYDLQYMLMLSLLVGVPQQRMVMGAVAARLEMWTAEVSPLGPPHTKVLVAAKPTGELVMAVQGKPPAAPDSPIVQ